MLMQFAIAVSKQLSSKLARPAKDLFMAGTHLTCLMKTQDFDGCENT